MCFSAGASFTSGVVISAFGILAVKHQKRFSTQAVKTNFTLF
jgi:hypothetical protein